MTTPAEREYTNAERRNAMREQRKRWSDTERRRRSELSRDAYLPQVRRMFGEDTNATK